MDAIYNETYKGHIIKIIQDTDAQSPKDWEDDSAFLIHYHRDCWIENPITNETELRAWYNGDKRAYKNYHVFAVSAYIHSGVRLSLENTFPSDSYGWDTSHVGAVLVSKGETKNKAQARNIALGVVSTWNDYLSGNVYGYQIVNNGDSCYGFYGDYKKGALEAAREAVDWLVKVEEQKKKSKKLRAYIINKAPIDKRT